MKHRQVYHPASRLTFESNARATKSEITSEAICGQESGEEAERKSRVCAARALLPKREQELFFCFTKDTEVFFFLSSQRNGNMENFKTRQLWKHLLSV